jgi:hypothetical protein
VVQRSRRADSRSTFGLEGASREILATASLEWTGPAREWFREVFAGGIVPGDKS